MLHKVLTERSLSDSRHLIGARSETRKISMRTVSVQTSVARTTENEG